MATKKKNDVRKAIGPTTQKIQDLHEKMKDNIRENLIFPTDEELQAKKTCSMCNKALPDEDFWKTYSYAQSGRISESGKIFCPVCRSCGQKLFDFYYEVVHKKDLMKALEHTCCDLNIYWDVELFNECKRIFENNERKLHILSEYVASVGRKGFAYMGKTYWDSPKIVNKGIEGSDEESEVKTDYYGWDTPIEWSKEDAENRKKILRVYRYDPFEEDSDEDRKALYRDLVAMLDDAMEDDYVKSRGALEVVRGFNRLEKLGKQIAELERDDPDNIVQIQKISDIKTKERNAISSFCKDNGFAASYQMKKSKGAGTLSGVLNEINEKQYESGLLNMYDVETSESIGQAAKASMQAIFDQLNFGANESYLVIQNQRDMIRKLDNDNKRLQEELRKANCKITEMKLKKESKEGAS